MFEQTFNSLDKVLTIGFIALIAGLVFACDNGADATETAKAGKRIETAATMESYSSTATARYSEWRVELISSRSSKEGCESHGRASGCMRVLIQRGLSEEIIYIEGLPSRCAFEIREKFPLPDSCLE